MFGIVLDFGLTGLFLLLDGIVYWLVSKLFGLYAALAGAEIIKNEFFQQITGRIYVIIGIFMLFVVAYSLLKALVNPDNLAKDTGKIVTNIIISLVLLSIVPLIFEYARDLQNIIVRENVIGRIILDNPEDNVAVTGRSISLSILETFLYIPDSEEGYSSNEKTIKLFGKEFDLGTSSFTLEDVDGGIVTWGQLKEYIRDGADANFMKIGYWAESVHEESNGTTYVMFVSTLAGAFLIYVLISFCLDLGIRVVKLAFYQLIAPIPILMRILPEKKSVFDNWLKASVATFMEVFIRLFIMFLVMWMVAAIFDGDVVELNNNVGAFGVAIIVLGIFAFAKQAPKLIGDVIGVDSGNIKLGIGGKLAAGGAFGLAAMFGGFTHTGIQNLTSGVSFAKNRWKAVGSVKGGWNKFKAAGSALNASTLGVLSSMGAGAVSGAVRSAKSGFAAKNFSEALQAANDGTLKAVNARLDRKYYRAGHGGVVGSAFGHVIDSVDKAKSWAGIGNIIQRVQFEDKFISAYDDYKNAFENGEYQALTAEINKYKAAKAAGTDPREFGISNFDHAIDRLKATQKKLRVDTLLKKNDAGEYIYKDMASYMIYNLSNLIQTNPKYAKELNLDTRMTEKLAKSITLRDNKILKDGVEMTANEIVEIMEATRYTLDAKGKVSRISDALAKGLYEDRSVADNARKADVSTVAYKEFKRQQEEAKKK